jgi:cyanophycinase
VGSSSDGRVSAGAGVTVPRRGHRTGGKAGRWESEPAPRPSFALLGSGEFEPWTEPVDWWLLERAAICGAGGGRVLILPTASAPEGDAVFDRWASMGLDHYRAAAIPAEVLPIKTRADAERPEHVARLADASLVFFSGGNPAYLAEVLAGSVFWSELLTALERGVAYAGCSAGIACLGEVAPDSAAASLEGGNLYRPGLRLFPKMYFGPHWDMLDSFVPGLREMIVSSVPADCRLLAIDERTAVVGDGATWKVLGSSSAALLEDGRWGEFGPGESFTAGMLATAQV